jgi:mannose-6-phosphate isomerase-like protein (cupin superfamily)
MGEFYYEDIHKVVLENENFRKVLYTTENMQLVAMCIKPFEDIGMEKHKYASQFVKIMQGSGKAIIDGMEMILYPGMSFFLPFDTSHNVINTGEESMKLLSIYSPPLHEDGLVQPDKPDTFIQTRNNKIVKKNITNIIYYK